MFSKKTGLVVLALCAVMVVMTAGLALANTSNGTDFQSIYDKVYGWVTGLPAIVIAFAIALIGVVRAFQTGSFVWAFAGILVAAIIFLLPTIMTGLGGCSF